ncbi:uncharacterized protein PV09_09268 [Verruconis gallopava]|uniref:SNF2 N-terminal domain-containing protein n=1 Tax=Verruconis gallopava TaxID=253628 RepID=A0A0D2AJA5_9PEZI|nr:uncharacterized protein PV09_09268 [Verruconis gallopava]KIV98988.1 hypothetical protein PV09_09268 [Verruconis gallopava]
MLQRGTNKIDIWALNTAVPSFRIIYNDTQLITYLTTYFTGPPSETSVASSFFVVQDEGDPAPEISRKSDRNVELIEPETEEARRLTEVRRLEDEEARHLKEEEAHRLAEKEARRLAEEAPRVKKAQQFNQPLPPRLPPKWTGHMIQIPQYDLNLGIPVPALSFDGGDTAGTAAIDNGEPVEGETDEMLQVRTLLSNVRLLEHMTTARFEEFCDFFELPHDISIKSLLRFPGIKTAVAIYQLFAAYFFVMIDGRSSSLRGGYLADNTGFGKSLEILLEIVLTHLMLLFVLGLSLSPKQAKEFATKNTAHGIIKYEPSEHEKLFCVEDDEGWGYIPHTSQYILLISKKLVYRRIQQTNLQHVLWSRVAADEIHESRSPNTEIMRFLFDQHLDTFVLMALATAWDKSPKDLQLPLQIIQRKWHTIQKPGAGKTFAFIAKNGI